MYICIDSIIYIYKYNIYIYIKYNIYSIKDYTMAIADILGITTLVLPLIFV